MPFELDAWNNEEPPWSQDDQVGGSGTSGTTFAQSGQQPRSTATQGEAVQPKRIPKAPPESGATSSSSSTFRSGPGPEPGASSGTARDNRDPDEPPNEDWIKRKRPSIEQSIHSARDYNNDEQRISFLKSNRNYIVSLIEGPHSTNTYGANIGWRQYLRRMTFHAALSYNILTEGQLDSQMINESDYEWLKLYHHIVTTTELIRCKGYPITEVLAMLTFGVSDTVDGQLRGQIKRLGSQVGQFIIKKPWKGEWDELGGM